SLIKNIKEVTNEHWIVQSVYRPQSHLRISRFLCSLGFRVCAYCRVGTVCRIGAPLGLRLSRLWFLHWISVRHSESLTTRQSRGAGPRHVAARPRKSAASTC